MAGEVSEAPGLQMTNSLAKLDSEGKFEKSDTGREQEPKKRKVSRFNIILLIIFLALLGIAGYYYLGDESVLGQCSLADECGKYDIFYVTGQGYVCANDEVVGENTIKNKLLMFKYASRRAVIDEPAECSCIESQCEVE